MLHDGEQVENAQPTTKSSCRAPTLTNCMKAAHAFSGAKALHLVLAASLLILMSATWSANLKCCKYVQ